MTLPYSQSRDKQHFTFPKKIDFPMLAWYTYCV